MPAKKISQLSAAATPLTGAEILPAVQAGASVGVTAADLAVLARRRELLAADRAYYVAPSGSDANTGLSPAAPFATRQKAWDTVAALDLNGFTVTIQVADGTYAQPLVAAKAPVGSGAVVFAGNPATPANVLISTTAADCYNFPASMQATVTIQDQKLQTTTSGNGVFVGARATVNVGNLKWGAIFLSHLATNGSGAMIVETGNCEILGNFTYHASALNGGRVVISGRTHTITGALAMTAYVLAVKAGMLNATSTLFSTVSGSLAGKRYATERGGIIDTGTDTGSGANATYFPGSVAGTASPGGSYW